MMQFIYIFFVTTSNDSQIIMRKFNIRSYNIWLKFYIIPFSNLNLRISFVDLLLRICFTYINWNNYMYLHMVIIYIQETWFTCAFQTLKFLWRSQYLFSTILQTLVNLPFKYFIFKTYLYLFFLVIIGLIGTYLFSLNHSPENKLVNQGFKIIEWNRVLENGS